MVNGDSSLWLVTVRRGRVGVGLLVGGRVVAVGVRVAVGVLDGVALAVIVGDGVRVDVDVCVGVGVGVGGRIP